MYLGTICTLVGIHCHTPATLLAYCIYLPRDLATANWLVYVLCIALGSRRDRNLGAPQLNPLLLFLPFFFTSFRHSIRSLALTNYTTGTIDSDDTIYNFVGFRFLYNRHKKNPRIGRRQNGEEEARSSRCRGASLPRLVLLLSVATPALHIYASVFSLFTMLN